MTIADEKAHLKTFGLRRSLLQFLTEFVAFAGGRGLITGIFVALGAAVEGVGLILLIPLLGIVIGATATSGRLEQAATTAFHRLGIGRPFGQLAALLAVFGALMVIRAAIILVRDVRVAELQAGFVEAKRLGLVRRLAAAPWDTIVRLRHARITQLMSGDMTRIAVMAQQSLQCVIAVALLLTQCTLVFLLTPLMAALMASLVIALMALAIVFIVPAVRQTHIFGGRTTNINLSLLDLTGQFLGGLKLAISQNLQTGFVAEFDRTLRAVTRLQIAVTRQLSLRRLVLTTSSAALAAALILVGFGIFEISPPRLIALLLIMTRMFGPVGQIQNALQQIAIALPVYDKVTALESELGAVAGEQAASAQSVAFPEGPIVFQAVTFRHRAEGDAPGPARGVESISLTIAHGEFVGVTGPSGAGKTTFADLLVGLFEPLSGRIAVGGVALTGAALNSWRDQVSYISQDSYLFHDTVRRNLAWANPRASEAEVWQALTLAGAEELVRRMPQGLDTMVGERGTLVSGGERQRLALARALLRRPRLLILDEPTGAIDVAGERDGFERLRALTPRPTVVMIAHRSESVALCDRVLRFEAGGTVDGGIADQPRIATRR